MRGEFLDIKQPEYESFYKHISPGSWNMGSWILGPRVPSYGVLGSHFRLCHSKGVFQEYLVVTTAFFIKIVTGA